MLLGLFIALFLGAIWQEMCTRRDRRKFPPPGYLVDVDGHRLHVQCFGDGRPAVVLESGLGCTSLDWVLVQRGVAEFAQVYSYDRAGRGYSDAGPRPRDAHHIARELKTLLTRIDAPPPYILVGHSFGGLYVRAFADLYQADVFGIVLVDASPEDQGARWPARSLVARGRDEVIWRSFQLNPLLARIGVLRLLNSPWASKQGMPLEIRSREKALGLQSRGYDWIFDEGFAVRASEAQARRFKPLGDTPLAVVTAAQTPDLSDHVYHAWLTMQRELCALSSNSTHIVATRSGHAIALEEPELIVGAIRWVIANAPRQRTKRA